MAVTTDQQFVDMGNHIDAPPYFGDRLVDAQGDHPASVQLLSGTYSYCVQFKPQDIPASGLGYEMPNSLAAYAKSDADPYAVIRLTLTTVAAPLVS